MIKQLGYEKFVFRILIDFQKPFNTGHDNIIQKLTNFGIRGKTKDFKIVNFQNRLRYVSVNSFSSNYEHICYGVSQGFILGLLLFLIYINNLHCAIKYL